MGRGAAYGLYWRVLVQLFNFYRIFVELEAQRFKWLLFVSLIGAIFQYRESAELEAQRLKVIFVLIPLLVSIRPDMRSMVKHRSWDNSWRSSCFAFTHSV